MIVGDEEVPAATAAPPARVVTQAGPISQDGVDILGVEEDRSVADTFSSQKCLEELNDEGSLVAPTPAARPDPYLRPGA